MREQAALGWLTCRLVRDLGQECGHLTLICCRILARSKARECGGSCDEGLVCVEVGVLALRAVLDGKELAVCVTADQGPNARPCIKQTLRSYVSACDDVMAGVWLQVYAVEAPSTWLLAMHLCRTLCSITGTDEAQASTRGWSGWGMCWAAWGGGA